MYILHEREQTETDQSWSVCIRYIVLKGTEIKDGCVLYMTSYYATGPSDTVLYRVRKPN